MQNIIVVVNQKGGVGKTTSVVNLASGLNQAKKKVLLIDLDPQANATTGSGIEKHELKVSVYDVLLGHANIADSIMRSPTCGYDILPANRNLAGSEIELVSVPQREYRLRDVLTNIKHQYDIILIDCPPSLSLLTLNGLAAANHLLVPIQCEYYALEGLTDLLNTVTKLKSGINPDLNLLGVVRTMFDKRNNLANQVSMQLQQHFNEKLFKVSIPRNVRLAEAPSFGMSAIMLDSNTVGAKAYTSLTRELLKRL
jgi:chromosome partitioning protein